MSLRVGTVFSGIGAIEFALKRMNIDHTIEFACDNGEREISYDVKEETKNISKFNTPEEKCKYVENLYLSKTRKTNFVQRSYEANYNLPQNRYFQDIKLLDGNDFLGKIDLFVGGSPCQSFSQVGYQKGLDDARGTLFYDYARLIKEIQPKIFIYENVRNMLNHDKGNTWSVIKNIFESLGYSINYEVLNSVDFGIPQNRRRLFVVGIKNGYKFEFPKPIGCKYHMSDFLESQCKFGCFVNNLGEIKIIKTPGNVSKEYILSNAVKKYVLKGGTKSFYQKPEVDLPIARTLLKTMGNHHRAGVDNYVTDIGELRSLTERECLRLMGFTDDFKQVVSKHQLYRQAGNSIVVDVFINIIKELQNHKLL